MRDNYTTVIYFSVAAILVIAAVFWQVYVRTQQATARRVQLTSAAATIHQLPVTIVGNQAQGQDISYMLLEPAQQMLNLAQSTDNDALSAMAYVQHGEALRTELHYRPGKVPQDQLIGQINRAIESYNKALNKAQRGSAAEAMAKFGMGLCQEELGDYEQAKKIYQELIDDDLLGASAQASTAEFRLEMMDNYKGDVPLAVSQKPEENNFEMGPTQSSQFNQMDVTELEEPKIQDFNESAEPQSYDLQTAPVDMNQSTP